MSRLRTSIAAIGLILISSISSAATISDVTLNFATGTGSSTLALDDYFGGGNLSYSVSTSSSNLLASVDAENILTLSLSDQAIGDDSFLVTVTATDGEGQSTEQSFTVDFELTRIYVNAAATGAGNGRTWSDAFTELRDAFAYASSGDEIWVAQGVYKPSGSDATAQFVTLDGLAVHGGFQGGETNLSEADPSTYRTVLSGDIDGDDTVDSHGITLSYLDHGPGGGNTSAPLVAIPASTSATLSGLTICGAASSGIRTNDDSSLTLSDCVISGNQTSGDGGAINAFGSSHTISDCEFLQNYAGGHGGGVRFGPDNGHKMTFDRCVISGNVSDARGGGLAFKTTNSANNSGITLRDCLLSGNDAALDGGAIHSWIGNTALNLINCTIASNHADGNGSSIFVTNGTTIRGDNCLIYGNSSSVRVGSGATVIWRSSLIENSGGSAAWDSAFGTDGGNNLDADPLFLSLPDASTAPTLDGDFTFDATSPAFDAGDDALSTSTADLIGNARINDAAIDMGAYENISLHRPTFTLPGDITINEDFGTYEDYFASDIQTNDTGQSIVGFTVTTDNDDLFSQLPTLDAGGYLEFTPADNAHGTATVTVVLRDNGASVNESLPQMLTITVISQTDAPTDMAIDNTTVNEGTAFIGTVSAIEPFGEAITYSIVNADDGQACSIDAATGELSFFYAPDFEQPWDSNSDNIYSVVIQATGSDGAQTAQFTITVLDLVDDFLWSNANGDNLWTTPGNWDVAQVPNTIANVYLAEAGTVFLNDGSTQEISTLRIGDTGGLGDLRLSNASQLSVSSGIIVGDGKDDRLSLEGGSILTTSGILKAYSTSDYSTTISLSGGSQWTHTYGDTIDIFGKEGEVTCTISDASNLTLAAEASGSPFKFAASGSVVNLNVAGSGSGFDYGSNSLQLGLGGEFHLTVSDNAAFGASDGGNITLGQYSGASVSASFLSGASLETGRSLSIKNGASLLMDDATVNLEELTLTSGSATLQNGTTGSVGSISFLAANPVTLDGAGTDITLSGSSPSLGDGGAITVQNGASAHYTSTTDFNLYGSGAAGSFTITGNGSSAIFEGGLTNTASTASATFTVAAGGSASFAGASQLTGSQNLVITGSGSSATFSDSLTLSGGNSLTVADGAELTVDGFLTIGSGETLELTGGATLVVSTVVGSPTNTSGTLSPGDGPKAVGIEGGYIQLAGGTLALEIGGTTQGSEYDYLYTLGYIDLAGTVSVTLVNDFEPAAGDSFTVLTSASFITDSGFSLNLPALSGGKQWETELTEDTLTLTVVAGDPLAAFRSTYGLAEDGSDDNADWSQNGIANILYLAFGLGDPNEASVDRTKLPSLETDASGDFVYTYRRLVDYPGLEESVDYTTDLATTWSDAESSNEDLSITDETITPIDDDYESRSLTIQSTAPGLFFRLAVDILDLSQF